jgi:NAD(P)-dependent dehydrogenase (short-subunit alcohol dehydrogenase family)
MSDQPKTQLLHRRTAFITGAARGIGYAVARAYLEQGASVVLADVRQADLERAAETLGGGERVMVAALDVTDEAATKPPQRARRSASAASTLSCRTPAFLC